MVRTTYVLTAITPMVCAARETVLMQLEEGHSDNLKFVLGSTEILNKIPIYLDSVEESNLCALISSVENDNGNALDCEDLKLLSVQGNYEIKWQKQNGKALEGILNVLIEEGASVQVSDSEMTKAIQKEVKRIVKEKITTQKEMDERLKVMSLNGVAEDLQLRILKKYRKYNKPAHIPSCIFQDPYLEQSKKKKEEGIIAEGLRAAADRNSIICEGEKSVGKNVYLETIAWLMNMPMYLITFSRQMSPSSIYGEKTTDNSAAKALSEFDSNILAKAEIVEEKRKFALNICYKMGMTADDAVESVNGDMSTEDKEILAQAARFKMLQAQSSSVNIIIDQSELYDWLIDGGLMCFNELNMCEANFFASFTNQLLDGTGFLFIPGRGEVSIHPDCVLFGTQNAECATCSSTSQK